MDGWKHVESKVDGWHDGIHGGMESDVGMETPR